MIRSGLVALLLAGCTVLPAGAVTVERWSASSVAEFELGSLDGTALDESGVLGLAPAVETLWGPDTGIVWALSPSAAGGVFVGLSSPGRLLYLPGDGDAETWLATGEESLIAAVAADGEGGVFFGESPTGKVLHVSATQELTEVADTGAKFVWALERAADGSLWIGTGLPGSVLRRMPDGEVLRVFDAEDDPVRCIAALEGGGVLVGTGGRGRVIRIDASGRPFVILDAEEAEIVGLSVVDDGSVYALAAKSTKQVGRPSPQGTAGLVETVRVSVDDGDDDDSEDSDEAQSRPAPARAAPRSFKMDAGATLYRIAPDGAVRQTWDSAREVPFAIVPVRDGKLLVATGDQGRVHEVDERGRAALLLSLPSNQASAMAAGPEGEILLGGTTDARVARLGPGLRDAGSYLSVPIDAGSVATWGRVAWDAKVPGGASLQVYLRAGNTSEPDATWSEWVRVDEEAESPGSGMLPASRWAQIRLDLQPSRRDESPTLRRLDLHYRVRNQRPVIESLTVQPAGLVMTRTAVQSTRMRGPLVADDPVARKAARDLRGNGAGPIRKSYELGARTVSWTASDPDRDRLVFDVEIQHGGSGDWIPLARDLDEDHFSFDTRGLPDGYYRCRLRARDRLDNPGGRGLEDLQETPLFQIDNTRPALERGAFRRDGEVCEVEFLALDPGGSVVAVDVAVDGGDWRPVDPLDGVADSPKERYRVAVSSEEGEGGCAASIRVRATDGAGNLGGNAWSLR